MQIEQRPFSYLAVLVFFLLLVLLVSCRSKDQLSGLYQAEEKDLSKQVETLIELKANGDGAWKVGNEEVPFAWYIKGAELRINTKGGGVVVGIIEGDTIDITLPGTRKMSFRKIR